MEGSTASDILQILTFKLDDELFAVEISRVREVLEFKEVTRIPRVPDFMRGVINLRGAVVPVIDLKCKFSIGETIKSVNTCVIISEVEIGGEPVVLGMLADAVQEVVDLDTGAIEPPPKIGARLDTSYIRGMGKHNDNFIILLDIDRIFTDGEIKAVAQAAR